MIDTASKDFASPRETAAVDAILASLDGMSLPSILDTLLTVLTRIYAEMILQHGQGDTAEFIDAVVDNIAPQLKQTIMMEIQARAAELKKES